MRVTKDVMPLPRREVPPLARIRQRLPSEHITDVRGEVRRRLIDNRLGDKIQRGHRIAITAGSRGIGGFVELIAGIADCVRSFKPQYTQR